MRRGLSQAFDSTPGLSLTTLVRAHGPVQANRRPVLSNGKVQIALRAMRVGVTATRTGSGVFRHETLVNETLVMWLHV
jgi:hypothetical protein